ncbi:LCP family protein [Clostridium algidicarnis]|nr:LCP family protein [Clostridium algidicarnis]MBU3197408.1 LCP family protein [Clostridium algidicarnis]
MLLAKKKKKSKKRRVLLIICFILLFIIGVGVFYISDLSSKVNTKVISKNLKDLGINEDLQSNLKGKGKDDIINIAFFGTDQRDKNEIGRSDAIMILTVDKDTKKIKLSSIMRDCYVKIDGHGKDKLNHAYAFGGPELSIKTLNQNFNLNIKDYASVNFSHLQDIVDAMGGVEVDITKEELQSINGMMNELADIDNYEPPYLSSPGKQTLNGKQALAYSRTRYIGNGDFDRADRQRTIINALFEKIKKAGVLKYPSIVNTLLPLVETSMESSEILKLGTDMLSAGIGNLEQERFPVDGYYKDGGEMIKGVWYLPFDSEATIKQMQDYIFNDKKPEPKKN